MPGTATSLSFNESQSLFGALKITLVSLLYSPVSNSDIMFYEVGIFPSLSQVYMTWLSIETSTAMTHKVQHCQLVVWKRDSLPDTEKNTTHIFWSGIWSRGIAKSCEKRQQTKRSVFLDWNLGSACIIFFCAKIVWLEICLDIYKSLYICKYECLVIYICKTGYTHSLTVWNIWRFLYIITKSIVRACFAFTNLITPKDWDSYTTNHLPSWKTQSCWLSLHFRSFTDLKVTACADLTESGDTVQVVGGHCLVLLLKEPEGTEGEASMVAVPVLMHGSHLVLRTPV